MIVDVVAWRPQGELPFDELAEAVNWVVGEQIVEPQEGNPKVCFYPITLHSDKLYKVGKLIGGYRPVWFAVIVSDEPVQDEAQAREFFDRYMEQIQRDRHGAGAPSTAGAVADLEPGVQGQEVQGQGTERRTS